MIARQCDHLADKRLSICLERHHLAELHLLNLLTVMIDSNLLPEQDSRLTVYEKCCVAVCVFTRVYSDTNVCGAKLFIASKFHDAVSF